MCQASDPRKEGKEGEEARLACPGDATTRLGWHQVNHGTSLLPIFRVRGTALHDSGGHQRDSGPDEGEQGGWCASEFFTNSRFFTTGSESCDRTIPTRG
jgi:hypothetical protein